MLKVILVVGARPNFMKVAPIIAAMQRRPHLFAPLIVHTGQHYDSEMSDAFFRDLELPEPDAHLGVGSGSHAVQTAAVMERFEPVVLAQRPDWVVVVGDVNSTLACALVCAKLLIKVAHVEAGLRSRDRTMPEETNRLLTDQIADLLLTPSADAGANLRAEGIPESRIRFVGNVMIDSLQTQLARAALSTVRERLEVADDPYAVLTLHRPSNVDDPQALRRIILAVAQIGQSLPVIFPVHPRTQKALDALGLDLDPHTILDSDTGPGANPDIVSRAGPDSGSGFGLDFQPAGDPDPGTGSARPGRHRSSSADRTRESRAGIRAIEPLGYLDFLRLYSGARLVLTDSGGIQEETTALGIPCLTLRENTERPITVELGTNLLVGNDTARILAAASAVLDGGSDGQPRRVPPLWDGHTADRILDALLEKSG